MPELPEVETSRREVERAAKGAVIHAVQTVEDAIVYDGVSPSVFERTLKGRRVTGSARRGKHFWLELDRRPWPVFHFGMTGWVHVYRQESARPRFWKLELVLDNGVRLAYRDPRRFGRLRLRQDPQNEEPIVSLGFDPVHAMLPDAAFATVLEARKAPIKAVLLDQSFCAGIGNWIADEVLYQSRIDPHRPASSLSSREVRMLRARLISIVARAIEVGADDTHFPRTWLFHYRWGKTKGARDGRGNTISFSKVGGRTTAWVPSRQK